MMSSQLHFSYFYIALPLVNSFLSFVVVGLFFKIIKNRLYSFHYKQKNKVLFVSFLTGILVIYSAVSQVIAVMVFVLVMSVTLINVRNFLKKLWKYLEPESVLTKEDMFNFSSFVVSLVTAFIVLNLAVSTLHYKFGTSPAFNFEPGIEGILDSIYFTFICFTTIGFGDIVPLTPFAKIIVSFESITGYIIFALFIGVVNKGITKTKPTTKRSQD